MPATVHGIGTRYCGKKNLTVRRTVCQNCGKESTLSSYDAVEFLVMFFIPFVPLGKRRVIDECEQCSYHRVMDLSDWERTATLEIQEALAEFRAHPGDGRKAIRLHGIYRCFNRPEEAGQIREFMEDKLTADGETQRYLGQLLNEEHRPNEALDRFERALALKPDDPAIRLATGLQRLDRGRLAEAHQLLRSYEGDQPERNPGVLVALANAYREAGEHGESLRLLELAGAKSPGVLRDRRVRQALRTSQQALGREQAPPSSPARTIWPWILGASGALIAAAVFFMVNQHFAQNRKVYIVNGSDKPVTVDIDGQRWQVRSRRVLTIVLPEGTHSAKYSGGIEGQAEFAIPAGFIERFSDSTVYVLNPNGEAVLGYETAEYAVSPDPNAGTYRIHYGHDLERIENVDYVFEAFPRQLRLEQSQRRVIKSRVEIVEETPTQIFDWLRKQKGEEPALKYAEYRLERRPQDVDLLSRYVFTSLGGKQDARVRGVMERGCAVRPVRYGWHEIRQNVNAWEGRYQEMLEQYEALLREAPQDPDRLCLRARLEPRRPAWAELVQRALNADPNHPVALGFMADQCAEYGEWEQARTHALKAMSVGSRVSSLDEILVASRLTLKEFDELEKYLNKRVQDEPRNYCGWQNLLLLHLEKKDAKAVQRMRSQYQRVLRQEEYEKAAIANHLAGLKAIQYYVEGRFEELLKEHGDRPNDQGGWRFEALLGLGRLDEAEKLLDEDGSLITWENLLTLSAALRAEGELERAEALFEQAREELLDGDAWEVALAGVLTTDRTPAPERLNNLVLHYRSKAVLAVVLAQREPERAAEMLALARKVSAPHYFPHHLIERLTKAAAGQ